MTEQDGDTYKHYLFEDCLPVRVIFNENGLRCGAQIPDTETQLSRMDREGFFEEIDKGVFDKLCDEEYAKRKSGQ